MIQWLKHNCRFNHNRVFCTGFSNGGMMCYRLASHPEASKLIRAIAPVGGVTLYPSQFPSKYFEKYILNGYLFLVF